MKKGNKMNYRKSKKLYKNTGNKIHKKNVNRTGVKYRGGYRL